MKMMEKKTENKDIILKVIRNNQRKISAFGGLRSLPPFRPTYHLGIYAPYDRACR